MKRAVIVFAVVANLVLADAVTKEVAEHLLASGGPVSVIPGFFDLALVHNRGCAWGLFQGRVWPLAAFGLVALAVLVWKRKAVFFSASSAFSRRLASVAEPLLYAGIIGNAVDRIFRGHVVDMLDFHWGAVWHYPCFNLADVCICVAAGLLILSSLMEKK